MTESTFYFFTVGTLLGLTAGISPGPLLTLVFTQTLKYSKSEGIKVAISPLITDLPIILITLLIFARLAKFDMALAIISFVGAAFVAFLGIESILTKGISAALIPNHRSESIKKGIVTNFLSPHPYLFWATIGTPLLFKTFGIGIMTTILFLASFYVTLIGSKVIIAIIVARTKVFINQKTYIIIMRVLGLLLIIFSILFVYEGIQYLVK